MIHFQTLPIFSFSYPLLFKIKTSNTMYYRPQHIQVDFSLIKVDHFTLFLPQNKNFSKEYFFFKVLNLSTFIQNQNRNKKLTSKIAQTSQLWPEWASNANEKPIANATADSKIYRKSNGNYTWNIP